MTISGGSDRVRYFASLGVFTQKGLFETFHENDRGFSYNRYNYRINMDIDVTKTTSMKINLGGRLTDKTEPNYNNGTYTDISYLYDNIYSAVPFQELELWMVNGFPSINRYLAISVLLMMD